MWVRQDNKNTHNYRVVAVDQTRTSTDVILAGFTRDVDAKRTNLDTTVRTYIFTDGTVLKLQVSQINPLPPSYLPSLPPSPLLFKHSFYLLIHLIAFLLGYHPR